MTDGVQGYRRVVSTPPDLIVLDVHLAGMRGIALCRWFKANAETARIPILFLSAETRLSDKLDAFRNGAVDYVLAPCPPEEFVARVGVHLRGAAAKRGAQAPVAGGGAVADEVVLVRAAQRELLENLSVTPSLAELATRLGVHPRRLSRAFHRQLRMTVFEYLREARMRRAQKLLIDTALSIVAISGELGYAGQAGFSNAFRRHTGQSPTAFRRRPGSGAS